MWWPFPDPLVPVGHLTPPAAAFQLAVVTFSSWSSGTCETICLALFFFNHSEHLFLPLGASKHALRTQYELEVVHHGSVWRAYFTALFPYYVYVCARLCSTALRFSAEKLSHTNAFCSQTLWWISSNWLWILITWHIHSWHILFIYGSSRTRDNGLSVWLFKLRQTITLDKQGALSSIKDQLLLPCFHTDTYCIKLWNWGKLLLQK